VDLKRIDEIINQHTDTHDGAYPPVIPILQDIQSEYRWLPEPALVHTAKRLRVPLVDLYGIATFYQSFRLTPPGEHQINLCMGTACHVEGAPLILGKLERKLGIKAGEVTEDGKFGLDEVRCVGCCALAPVMVVDEDYHSLKGKKDVGKIIDEKRKSDEKVSN